MRSGISRAAHSDNKISRREFGSARHKDKSGTRHNATVLVIVVRGNSTGAVIGMRFHRIGDQALVSAMP